MFLRALAPLLLLPLVRADSAADGPTCTPDGEGQQQACIDRTPASDEGEISSLLQRKPSDSSKKGKKGNKKCPIPSSALDTFKDGVNTVIDTIFSDVLLESPKVSEKFKVFRCKVKCSLEAHLNVTGLSSLALNSFDCDTGKCIEKSLGVCTKWRASINVGFTASELAVVGYGDANTSFKGDCYFLEALPDIPHFKTTARIIEPQLVMQLSADFGLDPPGLSNPSFAPVSFTYKELADFECGIHWFPTINEICNDYIGVIIDQFQETILGVANDGIHSQEVETALQDALANAAAKTKA